ncbi:MAG: DUF4349 domain-containing protein [Chitinophagaceae bacterium]|nr:MAG: DUF4349 domain-containing protein [Chitinophagaceae bacterium]
MKKIALASFVVLLFSACQQAGKSEQQDFAPIADSTGYAGAGNGYQEATDTIASGTGPDSKLVKTAALQLQVADVHTGTRALSDLAKSMGGGLRHQHVAANESATRELKKGDDSLLVLHALAPTASVTLRVPSSKLDEFLFEASRVASFIQSSDLDIDDRTLDYVSAQWRAAARQQFLENPGTSRKVTGSTTALAIRDEQIGQRIEQRGIDDAVRFSTVRIELAQPPLLRREVVVNNNLEAYTPSFASRLGDSLLRGWELFASVLLFGANLWVFILAGLLIWVAVRKWGKLQVRVQPAK